MSRALPPLNALRAFEAAARHQSFTKAAQELAVSHSAISRHVRGLEDRLSVRLFRDLPRGLALTQDGARYLALVEPALDQIAEATDALKGRADGVIVVSAEATLATRWLVPRLSRFHALYPDIELRLEASSVFADVERYEADIALRFYRSGRPDRPADLLSDAPCGVFAAPAVAAQFSHPVDLLSVPMLRDRGTDHWPAWLTAAGVDPALYHPPAWRMRAPLAIEAALYGQGVLLCSRDVVATALDEGRLIACFGVWLQAGAFYLVVGDTAARRKPVRLFRDWVLQESADLRSDAAIGESPGAPQRS